MLIINMPEDEYNDIKNNIRISVPNIINYIKNGKLIPDDSTNQNVLDIMFPHGYADTNNIEWSMDKYDQRIYKR